MRGQDIAGEKEKQKPGVALLCDPQGTIKEVLYDTLGLSAALPVGKPLTQIVDRGSLEKLLNFLVDLRMHHATFDWEINVPAGGKIISLHFIGVMRGEQMLIVAAQACEDLLALNEDMLLMENEEVNALRMAMKDRAAFVQEHLRRDAGMYDEISRLNNELIALQREVAKKNAELERLNASFDQAQRLAGIGSWSCNAAGTRMTGSDEFYRVLGLPPREHLDYAEYLGLVDPEDRAEVDRQVKSSLRGDAAYDSEHRIVRPGGARRIIHARGVVVFDERGHAVRFTGTVQDITERKQVEEALRESEKRFRGIYDQAPLGIALIDSITGKFLQVNQKYSEIAGLTPEKMLATDFQSITHPEDLQEDLDNMARLLRGEIRSFRMDKRYIRPDHSIIWVSLTVVPVWEVDTSPKCHIAMVEDITERRLAGEALRESERQLAEGQVLTGTGSWVMDLATGEAVFSDNMLRILGLPPGRHTYDEYSDMIHPEDRERRDAALEEAINAGKPYDVEFRIILSGGSVRHIHAIGRATLDSRGKPQKLTSTIQDITERKRAEEALTEAKAQSELYLDLMGHDINNMHQIALGYLDLARNVHPDVGSNDFLDKPIEVLQRAAQLIKNVQKLQKLSDGALQTQEVDVCQVLLDVQREFGAVPHKQVTLSLNSCERCPVMANELLHDVFANLVGNAIKHTGDRGKITINQDVVVKDGSRHCRVSVEDDGPGVADDLKPRIFNRLQRGATKAKGLGLGLYLVKSLVESYGGRVWVEDRVPGDRAKGAKFVVTLPAIGP